MVNDKVYVVTSGSYSDYSIDRVYATKAEAERFVDARKQTYDADYYEIEEWPLGGPRAEYDDPIWEGVYRLRKVEKPEPWTLSDIAGMRGGFVGYRYTEMFTPREYTGELKESFDYREIWHTGEAPPKAKVHYTSADENSIGVLYAVVRGASREHVEKLLQDTAARMKAERAGLT